MKNTMKKIMAIVIAGMLVVAMAVPAMADAAELTNGEAGTWTSQDEIIKQDRSVNIKKELISYNANSTSVYAPAFSYVYTITPAGVGSNTVTDDTADHKSSTAVQVPVNSGITTNLKVNDGTAGDANSAVGTLAFTNTTQLTTSSSGATNTYDVNLDFSTVAFEKPGVYRYQIDETLADSATYAGIDIADGSTNTLYLDVYVDGNDSDSDGYLDIYGYVCMAANNSVTTSTEKTNGFVAGSNGADSYYTYDLTLSKDVVNDSYDENNTAFPFTVIFNNNANLATTYTITETVGNGSTGINPATATNPIWSGVALVKDGGAITYAGIPAGVDVDVYETNIATGVTYTVTTSVNSGTDVTDNNVSWGSTPTSVVAQTTKALYESTKATVDTSATTTVNAIQTIAITNTLLQISPTGVILRVAPYLAILVAGLALVLVLAIRRRRTVED